jgi:hypothetical protein
LTLPTQSALNAAMPSHSSAESNTAPTQNDHASSSSSQAAEDGPDSHHDVDAPYIAPAGAQSSSSSPSRYCSVKGCKAMISGDYFFKMCEPCRDRYRGYGITKRAKWRAERVAANAELEALRIEEDKRRADEGLPVRILTRVVPQFHSERLPMKISPWPIVLKTGSPGRTTSLKGRFSSRLKINTAPFPHVCVLSRIVTLSCLDSTNIVAASSTGCRIDIIAN